MCKDTWYRFDVVSLDNKVVGDVKASGLPKRGELRGTQIAEMCEICLFLLGVEQADRRLLVLTERDFYERFIESRQAKVAMAKGIEIMHVNLGT